jgi:hypothetical protein
MNAGFSSLAWLKARLLLASDAAGTAYDDAVVALGLGVASQCEDFCGRKFGRMAGDVHETRGDRTFVVVPRYPVESVASVQSRASSAEAWLTVDASNYNVVPEAADHCHGRLVVGHDGG